jgi:hypothetical protein
MSQQSITRPYLRAACDALATGDDANRGRFDMHEVLADLRAWLPPDDPDPIRDPRSRPAAGSLRCDCRRA